MTNKELIISGYALCWNERAFIEEQYNVRFYEQFQRGAFAESIQKQGQKLWLFHKKMYEIECDLTFMEDDKGLAFIAYLANNSDGRLAYNAVRDGSLKHVSIGFSNKVAEIGEYRHFKLHTVQKVDLYEISLVDNPAYKTSTVRVGCVDKRLNMLAQISRILESKLG